jgi:uncharacterized protein (TIGR03118 family)
VGAIATVLSGMELRNRPEFEGASATTSITKKEKIYMKHHSIAVITAATLALPSLGIAAGYTQKYLSADTPGVARYTDALLLNPWGLSVPPEKNAKEAFWWAADNASGVSTLYDPKGATRRLIVTVPSADGVSMGSPTGTTAFDNNNFVFVTEDGTISEWLVKDYVYNQNAAPSAATIAAAHAPSTDIVQPETHLKCEACHVTNAVLKVKTPGAAYEGVTVAQLNGAETLLVANVNSTELEAYDTNFATVPLAAGAFSDPQLPAGFTATNVQTAGGLVWVVYVSDAGGGYVDGYNLDGTLKVRLQQGNWFDDPWGVAVSPSNFGTYSNDVLVGNVGSGKIAAFDVSSGQFQGYISDSKGQPIANPGLWAIAFGIGNHNNGPTNVLYFNSGTESQTHGIFGSITASRF